MNYETTPIVKPHRLFSRPVEEKDINRVYEDAKTIYKIFGKKIGMYNTFLAIAHPQITKDDPLRFFVVNPKLKIAEGLPEAVIINPEIIRHTNNTVDSEEGCLSFPTNPPTIVQRWNKCEVRFKVLTPDKQISDWHEMNLSGMMAKVWQHEMDHLDARYIYEFI
jgi:peptide deformylase